MPESFWQLSHKSSEKWSDCSILHMLVWICLNSEPELDGLWKIGHSIVRWVLASHEWISIQKTYPKVLKKPRIQHLRSLVTWCLQPNSSRHGGVPIRSMSSIAPLCKMELACSVKCGTRKKILDSSGWGPRWKHEFHHHTKCKPVSSVSSSYKVQASVVWI
jgi:hypothetical protein